MQDARYGYLRWGAEGKVRQLEELYPDHEDGRACARPDEHDGGPPSNISISRTVIKVSQAISGEIVLEKLIDTLMRTAH